MGKKLSIWAFVLSFLFFVPFSPIVAIVLGVIALFKREKNDPGYTLWLAIVAIIIGFIMIFVSIAFWGGVIIQNIASQ